MITLEYLENINLIANINLDWMIDKNGYKQTAEEAGAKYK